MMNGYRFLAVICLILIIILGGVSCGVDIAENNMTLITDMENESVNSDTADTVKDNPEELYFDMSEADELDFYKLYTDELSHIKGVLEEIFYGSVVFGDAVFYIEYDCGKDMLSVNSAEIYGEKYSFLLKHTNDQASRIVCAPTAETKVILYDGTYIITDFIHGKAGSLWCISGDGYFENHSFGSDENADVIWFEKKDDGTLSYERWVKKYYNPSYVFDVLEFCISREERCYERGSVTFENGTPILSVEESYTAGEIYDLDGLFEEWTAIVGQTDYESLDELIEYNKNNK